MHIIFYISLFLSRLIQYQQHFQYQKQFSGAMNPMQSVMGFYTLFLESAMGMVVIR